MEGVHRVGADIQGARLTLHGQGPGRLLHITLIFHTGGLWTRALTAFVQGQRQAKIDLAGGLRGVNERLIFFHVLRVRRKNKIIRLGRHPHGRQIAHGLGKMRALQIERFHALDGTVIEINVYNRSIIGWA